MRAESGERSVLMKWLSAVLTTVLVVALTSGAAQADDVGVLAISHRSPFSCGKTFYANNWSPGHSPSGAIDWQSYGDDAVGGETVRATAAGTATFSTTLSADVGI